MSEPAQHWNPERYARVAGFVAELGLPVVALLAPQPGERILDLGCGDGALTARLVELGCDVLGVDSSPAQITAARKRGLRAEVAEGEQLAFDGEFDAVFSNAALHWMPNATAVIDGVWRALRPGGRFVGEMGGAGNVATIQTALVAALARRGLDGAAANPWYFPTPDAYRQLLTQRGFEIASLELISRPTPLTGELADWLDTFAQSFLAAAPRAERVAILEEVSDATRAELCDEQGVWTADYVRLRFSAHKLLT